ncbi:MAG: hypothetical protein LBS83_02360, partial [Holosporales bacterium]|nr:hypothetical protein [Holosporales bacterium]
MVTVITAKVSRIKFRGFGSMSKEKIVQIAKAGGTSRAKQLGHKGYVELGRVGGKKRSSQLTHEELIEMGRKGGIASSKKRR